MHNRTGHKVRRLVGAGLAAIAVVGFAACSSGSSSDSAATAAGNSAAAAPVGSDGTTGGSSSPVHLVDVVSGQALAADPSVVVIDVRTPEEFAEGHLERAELVDLSAADFRDRIATFDRSATYFVYCRSGNRSAQATAIMADLGFVAINELDGGIIEWQAAGAAVVK